MKSTVYDLKNYLTSLLFLLIFLLTTGCNLVISIYNDKKEAENNDSQTSVIGTSQETPSGETTAEPQSSLPVTPSPTPDPAETPSPTPTMILSPSPTPAPTLTPTPTPTLVPTPTPTPTLSPPPVPNDMVKRFYFDTSLSGAGVSATINEFPVLLKITDPEIVDYFWSGVPDLCFIDNDDTTSLNYEIEYYDAINNLAIIWVRVPVIEGYSNTDYITMHLDSTLDGMVAGNSVLPEGGVFAGTNDYTAVWHLGEDSANTTVTDSVGIYDGNMNEATSAHSREGIIGNALEFDGVNDYINCGSGGNLDDMTNFTWSAWIYPYSDGNYCIVDKSMGYFGPTIQMGAGTQTLSFLAPFNSNFLRQSTVDNVITLNDWNLVSVTWNGNSDASYVKVFINGEETLYAPAVNGSGTITGDTGRDFYIGNRSGNTDSTFDGIIDDVTVSNIIRSESWLKLSFENQKNGQSLVSDPEVP